MVRATERLRRRDVRVRPGFSSSWLLEDPPDSFERVLSYAVGDSRVSLWRDPDGAEVRYQLEAADYLLTAEEAALLARVRTALLDEDPADLQATDMAGVRSYIERTGRRLLVRGEAGVRRTGRQHQDATRLAALLARYTAGFGVLEHLLLDPHVQDVYIDAPAHRNPVHVSLAGLDDPRLTGRCVTNILLTDDDLRSLVARVQYESGQPLSEARPHLEADLGYFNTRVTVVGPPLSPAGTAVALRRHASEPWTLPRLVASRSLTAGAAALLSFFLDGQSTVLVAGSRGAGKTSLLGALLFEFPPSQRILTLEDTPELPHRQLQELGFKVQSLVTASATGGGTGVTALDALRVSLRLGESVIALGEVRGEETRVLYEAMRTGSAGSSVLGTIHGSSPEAVYDRVVHDLGIPPASFAATDLVVIAGLRRPGGQQRRVRRVLSIAEVVKGSEGRFLELVGYDKQTDSLVPRVPIRDSPRFQHIARSWGLTLDQAESNLTARRRVREIIDHASAGGEAGRCLGPEMVRDSNSAFWAAVDREGADAGAVLARWEAWFRGGRRR